MSISNNRKIKTPGINPSSYLIHPVTLKIINKNKINNNKKLDNPIMCIPDISISSQDILKAYNINYISDLEKDIQFMNPTLQMRLLKLFFGQYKNLKNLTESFIPNIIRSIGNYFKISEIEVEKKLKNIDSKNFEELFYLT